MNVFVFCAETFALEDDAIVTKLATAVVVNTMVAYRLSPFVSVALLFSVVATCRGNVDDAALPTHPSQTSLSHDGLP